MIRFFQGGGGGQLGPQIDATIDRANRIVYVGFWMVSAAVVMSATALVLAIVAVTR